MPRLALGNVLSAALISAALALPAIGCDEGKDAAKTTLSEVIPNPVQVTLGLVTGTMTFDFSAHPLDLDKQYDLELFLYTGGIGLTVTDDETGVTYDLNQGSAVMTTPDQAGEYFVDATPDGKTVTVSFYNWFQGASISAGGDYSAAIQVLENEFFVTEAFTRDVTVS